MMHFLNNLSINLTTTDVTALVGAITGSLSLLIQTIKYRKERPKISIYPTPDREKFSVWAKNNSESFVLMRQSEFSNPHYFLYLIQITIENNSASPVTIISPISSNKEIGWSNDATYQLEDIRVINPKTKETSRHYAPQDALIKFPYRLDAYDSISGSILFFSTATSPLEEFTVELHTPLKIFNQAIKLHEIRSVLKSY